MPQKNNSDTPSVIHKIVQRKRAQAAGEKVIELVKANPNLVTDVRCYDYLGGGTFFTLNAKPHPPKEFSEIWDATIDYLKIHKPKIFEHGDLKTDPRFAYIETGITDKKDKDIIETLARNLILNQKIILPFSNHTDIASIQR